MTVKPARSHLQLGSGGGSSHTCSPLNCLEAICHMPHAIIVIFSEFAMEMKTGMGCPNWRVSVFDIHPNRLQWCSGLVGMNGMSRHSGRKCSHHKWLASRMTWNVEEAETILGHTIDRLEERGLEGARDQQSPFKGPSSVRRTLELEMQSWGNFLETGKALMGFSERVYNYTIMYLTDLPHQPD